MNRSDSLYAMQEKEKTIGSEERGLTDSKDEVRAPIHLKRGSGHIIPDLHTGDKGCHRKERTYFGIVPNTEQVKQESSRSWKCGLLLFFAFLFKMTYNKLFSDLKRW